MKPHEAKFASTVLKIRGHLSCLFPAKTKAKREHKPLSDAAVILFDFCSRKRSVPPEDEWPDEVADGLRQALIDCDGDFFRTMADAADSMDKGRSSHAEHVTSMIYFAAKHLETTGDNPTKQQLIEGTHKLMVKMGKPAIAIETPQLWTPVISAAGFASSEKARSKGTTKNHGEGATTPRKRK